MGISKNKRKLIKGNYPKHSVDEIAAMTGLKVQDIEKFINIQHPETGSNFSEILNSMLEWGIVVMVFLAPFMLIPWLRDASNLPQNAFVQTGTFFLAVIWVLKGIVNKELQLIPSSFLWPLSIFSAWCLISLFVAVNPFEGIAVLFQVVAMVCCFALVLNVCHKKENYDKIVWALLLAGFSIAVIGICQHLFKFSMIPQIRPPAATFSNRNLAAQFMVLSFPSAIYLFLKTDKKSVAWFTAFIAGMMLVYVAYTKALAAWISIAVELAVLVLILTVLKVKEKQAFQIKSKQWPLWIISAVFLLLVNMDSKGINFNFSQVSNEIGSIREFIVEDNPGLVENKKKISTIQWRWSVWQNSTVMIKDYPILGTGAGNYKIEYPLYNQKVVKDEQFNIQAQLAHAHNDYIQAAAEYGITGLIIVFFTIGLFYYYLIVVLKNDSGGKNFLLAAMIFSIGFGMLFNAAFDFPFQRAIPPFYIMVLSGIAASLFARLRKTVPKRITHKGKLNFITVVMGVLLVFYSIFHYVTIQYDHYLGRTIVCYNQGRWDQCLTEADQALSYTPYKKEILFYKGYACFELGRIEESRRYYEELLTYFPNYINGRVNLALIYEKLEKPDLAFDIFAGLIAIMPDQAGYYSDAGHNLMKMGKIDAAYDYLKKAVELNAANEIIQFNFGVACVQKKRDDEAKEAFKKALEIKPGWDPPLQYMELLGKQDINEKQR